MYYFSKGRNDIVVVVVSDPLLHAKLTVGRAIKIVKTATTGPSVTLFILSPRVGHS